MGRGGADALSAEAIRSRLTTMFVGRNLAYFPAVPSTNDIARRLAQDGAPEGTVVVADHQTAGRGRMGRRWCAPPGAGLLLSLLFRPQLAPHQVQRLTMVCSLAVLDAVAAETGLSLDLKWPNDVVAGGAKVAGLLSEVALPAGAGGRVEYAVVGIGLNANLDPAELPADLIMPATSLSALAGRRVARLPLLVALLAAVEARYLALRAGRSPHREWAGRLTTLGRRVAASGAGTAWEGVAEAVDADGALLLRLDDGRTERVVAGDVTLRPSGARSGV